MIPSTLLMPVKSYLERRTADRMLAVMDWLPQSPDLNIIEAVWDHLDRERNERSRSGKYRRKPSKMCFAHPACPATGNRSPAVELPPQPHKNCSLAAHFPPQPEDSPLHSVP